MTSLTILICTHNRRELLARTLHYINSAHKPADCSVEILVVANACTDGTHTLLEECVRETRGTDAKLSLRWISEPTPGKSHALNRAIPEIHSDLVAFVDDDHRVDAGYLEAVCTSATTYPDATIFCGRILPDWDGAEPRWVHDDGPYRIYPLPVPRFDHGLEAREFDSDGPIPGGGNLVLRRTVFERVDGFTTDLGPHGHDLGGGEDTEFVLRALKAGERLQYVPAIVQHHFVDSSRLKFNYLLRKAYQRTRATARTHGGHTSIPRYIWRKLATYAWYAGSSLSWSKRRFFFVRLASTLGELKGIRESLRRLDTTPSSVRRFAWIAAAGVLLTTSLLVLAPPAPLWPVMLSAISISGLSTLALLLKSLRDFTRTGPAIQEEIRRHYRRYTLYALTRLFGWTWLIMLFIALGGIAAYVLAARLVGWNMAWPAFAAAGVLGILLGTVGQFIWHLYFLPAILCASLNYRPSRLYRVWGFLSNKKLLATAWSGVTASGALLIIAGIGMLSDGDWRDLGLLIGCTLTYGGLIAWARHDPEPSPFRARGSSKGRPNILLLGSDTLRADRLGAAGYHRRITPNLDRLAQQGTQFTNCYVPCARTAPSLVSLLTGAWPHHHGIRDNFVSLQETRLSMEPLPSILKNHGYRTAAISDWCGADLGKFPFGFEHLDLPEDQWNLKFLIRQGPKDLRLFLSLFTHNRFGKTFLPEIYYLAGVPLTHQVGRETRRAISAMAKTGEPFLINAFFATTHPPFGSDHPYYMRFSDPRYSRESKFVMARLTDPWDILRRQGEPREEFDLDQIIDLYDGCVAEFDDEVGKMLRHLDACGLTQNTIVVVYSDHGMEFFEHGTWGQGNSAIGDQSPRIPLIIADPRQPASARVTQVVRSIDLPPTLLDLAEIPIPTAVDGVSLEPLFNDPDHQLDLPAFSETGIWLTEPPGMSEDHIRYPDLFELLEVPDNHSGTLAIKPEYFALILRAKDRMIRKGRWKLVYQPLERGTRLLLFDLEYDPLCQTDIAQSHPQTVTDLWNFLQTWIPTAER